MLTALSTAPLGLTMTTNAQFARGNDFLGTGAKVSARQVANAIGRWQSSHDDWNSIGAAGKLDAFINGDYYEDDAPVIDYSTSACIERRPGRRDFCRRNGLVQRWAHNENLALLPFGEALDDGGVVLAASVGATPAELQAEPLDPLALDVVFDALCTSQSGFVDQDVADRQRAAFVAPSGAFDAAAFDTALNDARKNVAFGYAVYPGLLWAVAITVAIQLDLYHELLDSASDKSAELQRSWQTYGPAPFLLPVPVVYLLATGAKGGGLAEANMRADDAIWIEKMRAKRAGKAVDD